MNVLLLGNGFDLYHSFPTRYVDFLKVVKYLIDNYDETMNTVGKVFSQTKLHETNINIAESYNKHSFVYDKTELNAERIIELITMAKNNIWYQYLLKSFNKDVGWIDFEKEIASVIDAFSEYFSKFKGSVRPNITDMKIDYIILFFGFFLVKQDVKLRHCSVKEDYYIELPLGSKNQVLNKDKIILELHSALQELAEMLRIYLNCFVDEPLRTMKKVHLYIDNPIYSRCDYVINFNYTNTFELLYGCSSKVVHIHGNLKDDIVLGVNSNNSDEIPNLDISFIQFKKYYQRILYQTDVSCFEKLKELSILKKAENRKITLHIIGHSLDRTDEDMIRAAFEIADEIIIYYHKNSAIGEYVKNLVTFYGKASFDDVRIEKRIQFKYHPPIDLKK